MASGGFDQSPIQGEDSRLKDSMGSPKGIDQNETDANLVAVQDNKKKKDDKKGPQASMVAVTRGEVKNPVDAYWDEQGVYKTVTVGGFWGTELVPIDKGALVRGKVHIEPYSRVQVDQGRRDGLFTLEQDLLTSNLQRQEQRLLWSKDLPYFNRSNFEMKLDSDLTTHTISRPMDISLECNPAMETKSTSATFSHRNNANKINYYRLDINIGKLQFKDHEFFVKEDALANKLNDLYYAFEKRVQLCLVDHLYDRINVLKGNLNSKEDEQRQLEYAPSTSQKERLRILTQEIELIRSHIKETEDQFRVENDSLQKLADELYDTWVQIKQDREDKMYSVSSVKLQVREFQEAGQRMEYDFYLRGEEPSKEKKYDDRALPGSETKRRNNVNQTRIFLRLLVNNVYVARTRKQFIRWPQFEVPFMERFQLHVFTRPVDIEVQVCTGLRWSRTIAKFKFEPPGLNVNALTSAATVFREENFIGDRQLPKLLDNEEKRVCHGSITIKSEWVGQSPDVPPVRFEDLSKLKNYKSEELDEEKRKLVEAMHVDVNDPRNKTVLDYIKQLKSKNYEEALMADAKFPHYKYESLRHRLMSERFRSADLVKYPVPLLERDILNAPIFMRFLQARKMEIVMEEAQTTFPLHKYRMAYSNSAENKARIRALVTLITERQNQVRLGVQKVLYSLKNVVDEFIILERSFLLQCWKILFTPRRKLKPARGQVKTVSGASVSSAKIMLNIYRGSNIPVRNEAWSKRYAQVDRFYQPKLKNQFGGTPRPNFLMDQNQAPYGTGQIGMSGNYGNNFQNPGLEPTVDTFERVQSFVEVRLVHNGVSTIVRTAPFDGTNPEWNELLELSFNSLDGQGFTKSELQDCDSTMYFNVYDQVINVKKAVLDINEVNVRAERRYLGSFNIPLLTVFQNSEGLDASFRVRRPLILFGYHSDDVNPFIPEANAPSGAISGIHPDKNTYIDIKINLDPVLELPTETEADYYPGFENATFLYQGSQWILQQKQRKVLKDRVVKAFAENTEGKSVFIPRFITPLAPPPEFDTGDPNDETLIEKCIWHVSLIPHVEDNKAFKDLPDVWSTCQELIDLCAGDFEEHAILLCNYFKYLDNQMNKEIKTYIVLGNGVPEGNTVYVLRKDNNSKSIELWNASTGVGYAFDQEDYGSNFLCFKVVNDKRTIRQESDLECPLKSVGCLIDEDDVYINIQESADPTVISYDLENKKNWLSFLGKKGTKYSKRDTFFPQRFTSIQKPLIYEYPPEIFAQNLQLEIEKSLKDMFQEARLSSEFRQPKTVTWNDDLADEAKEIMPYLEEFSRTTRRGAHSSNLYRPNIQPDPNFKYRSDNIEDKRSEEKARIHLRQLQDIQQKFDDAYQKLDPKYEVFGFPLHQSFIDIPTLWEAVKNTDMHNISNDTNRFVLAVRVFSYSCYISSIWMYVAALFDPL